VTAVLAARPLRLMLVAFAVGCGDATAEPGQPEVAPAAVEAAVEAAPVEPEAAPVAAAAAAPTCETCPKEQPAEDGLEDTELPLTLLATAAAADPTASGATIRDDPTGVIRVFRVGDLVWEGTTIAAIERGSVVLARAGQRERLAIDTAAVELRATDVYYPDLFADEDFAGVLTHGVQLPPGPGYVVKNPEHAWGTPRTIRLLQDAIRDYTRGGRGGPKVHVGDLSLRGGGVFPPHLSHRHGRDIDVGYVLRGADADVTKFVVADSNNLDVARSWALIEALIATGQVHYVFMDYGLQRVFYEHAAAAGASAQRLSDLLQYPRGEGAPAGIIRHWRGHRNHFHVRFRE
jgi:hypothetical protein